MKKIAFFCIPAQGHINPTLAVVRELTARGHHVRYYSYESLRERIEQAGAEFFPCDKFDAQLQLDEDTNKKVGQDLAFSTKLLVDTTLSLGDAIKKDIESFAPDCIVADSMAVWGKAVALKLGIPYVCSTTTFAFNKHSAAAMKKSGGELIKMLISMPKVNRQVKRLRDNGYPVKNILDIIANDNDTHTIVYTSPAFQPFSETFSDKYCFVGPLPRKAEKEYEKKADKLIYVSMGTVNNELAELYKCCIAALGNSGYQLIMSVGDKVDTRVLGDIPENVELYPYVDQMAVLEKADAFISHCGMNSVSESLYCAVPLVLLPITPEQSAVAKRVDQLGAGIIPQSHDADALRQAVAELLADERYKKAAEAISAGFKSCPGAVAAADKIISLCR